MPSRLNLDRSLNRLLLGAALLLLALGLWQLGGAAAIHGKAWLAQRLLDRAWAATLAGQRQVRPWPWADTWPVARLQVPELGVDLYVLAGASGRTLAFGPALIDGPERFGHLILSGHRDTHFAFLRHLSEGARLRLQDPQGSWQDFDVHGHEVIDVRHPVFARRAEDRTLVSLVTCYPFDAVSPGGPLRYVVSAQAVQEKSVRLETAQTKVEQVTAASAGPLEGAASSTTGFGGTTSGEGLPDGSL